MNTPKKIKYNRGISYIEIIIAAAILGIVVLAFAQLFMKNNIALNHAKMQTQAANWASDKIEDIKALYYVDITTGAWVAEREVLGENRKFTRTVTVSEIKDGLKEVEIVVTWDAEDELKNTRMVSNVARYIEE